MAKEINIVVIAVIRNKQGKYLLTLRAEDDPEDKFHNIWQLPGGGVEWGEKLEDALKREMREEIGVEINVIKLIPKIFESIRDTSWHGIFPCFLCELVDENAEIVLNSEASDFKWCTPDEVKTLPSFPETNAVIALAHDII
jgi:mutator protein MutT